VTQFTPKRVAVPYVYGGIQFDAASNSGYQSSASSLSWSHTWSGANRFLAIDISLLSANDTVTAVTYGGATCTLIGTQNVIGGTGRVECWGITQSATGAPNAGTNTISVTLSGTLAVVGTAASYVGVNQANPAEAFTGASAVPISASASATVTTLTNNDWVHAALMSTAPSGVAAGQTSRNLVTGLSGTGGNEDTGPVSPAGSQTMTWSGAGTSYSWSVAAYGVVPYSTPFGFDEEGVTLSFSTQW